MADNRPAPASPGRSRWFDGRRQQSLVLQSVGHYRYTAVPTIRTLADTSPAQQLHTIGRIELCYTCRIQARHMLHRLGQARRVCGVQFRPAVPVVPVATRTQPSNRHRLLPTTNPSNVELAFETKLLRDQCERRELAEAEFGMTVARTLRNRIADLRAAQTLADLIAGKPRWVDSLRNTLTVDLTARYRMVLSVNHPVLGNRSRRLSDDNIHRVKLLRIEIHDG